MCESCLPSAIRDHAALLRSAGASLRQQAYAGSWRSPAADRMRAEVDATARWLEWCATRYESEADQLAGRLAS